MADRYQILRRIESGGTAEVFEALARGEDGFTRKVAFKRLAPHLAGDPSLLGLFLDEARLLGRLRHPNVVSIVDYGVADGLPFQVLEWMDTGSLADLGTAGISVALAVVVELARGLEYVHAARDDRGDPLEIVHRDVTPGNVLLSSGGEVKLADFGIAIHRARSERTSMGMTRGTPEFMAPEQLRGDEVDRRTDIFALGLLLHHVATGERPLSNEAAREALARGAPLVLQERPEAIASIVERAIQVDPERRYPDAGAFREACSAVLRRLDDRDPRDLLAEHTGVRGLTVVVRHRRPLDDLFDLELIAPDLPGAPVRRFTSVVRSEATVTDTAPSETITEVPRDTVLLEQKSDDTRLVRPVHDAPRTPLLLLALGLAAATVLGAVVIAMARRPEAIPIASPEVTPSPRPVVTGRAPPTETEVAPAEPHEPPAREVRALRPPRRPAPAPSPAPPPDVARALDEVGAALEAAADEIPEARFSALEARYLALRLEHRAELSERERRDLERRVRRLLEAVRAARR